MEAYFDGLRVFQSPDNDIMVIRDEIPNYMRPAPVTAEGFARRSPAPKWSRNAPTAKASYSLP